MMIAERLSAYSGRVAPMPLPVERGCAHLSGARPPLCQNRGVLCHAPVTSLFHFSREKIAKTHSYEHQLQRMLTNQLLRIRKGCPEPADPYMQKNLCQSPPQARGQNSEVLCRYSVSVCGRGHTSTTRRRFPVRRGGGPTQGAFRFADGGGC